MLPELVAGRFAQEAGRAIKIVRSQADVGQNPSILRQAQNGAAQGGAGLTLGKTLRSFDRLSTVPLRAAQG